VSTISDHQWLHRYLALLDLEPEQPSIQALARLTRSHLLRVPFENVTSLLRRAAQPEGPVPALDHASVLDAWERGTSGGLCFEVAAMLSRLLPALGYETKRVLGRITFPASHQAIVVTLAGRDYLVDLGCGAPLFEPIPLEGVQEVHRAGLSYRFRLEDGGAVAVQDRLLEGHWQPFCYYDLAEATPRDCDAGYQRHHQPPESWVVSSLTLVRCREDEVLQLRDGRFSRYRTAGKTSEPVSDFDDYMRLVREDLGFKHLPISDGIRAYQRITGNRLDA
jgi:arylamine N-acetyltransferase